MKRTPEIEALLKAVFLEVHEQDEPQFSEHRDEFVFQMTDCLGDLERVVALFRDPHTSAAAAAKELAGFLIHTPPHLRAAGRLLIGETSDPFALSE